VVWLAVKLLREGRVEYRSWQQRWGLARRTWHRDLRRLAAAGIRVEQLWNCDAALRSARWHMAIGEPVGIRYVAFNAEIAA
jgi:hypothetical protein